MISNIIQLGMTFVKRGMARKKGKGEKGEGEMRNEKKFDPMPGVIPFDSLPVK